MINALLRLPVNISVPAVRAQTIGGLLGDIDSHMPSGHVYRNNDKVTWAIQTVRAIHATIRNRARVACGLYYFADRGLTFPTTGITLCQVADAVSPRDRGPAYQSHLIGQKPTWNANALYLLDEAIACMSGAVVGYELGMDTRAKESKMIASEMLVYSGVLHEIVKRRGYDEASTLSKLVSVAGDVLNDLPKGGS